jgi:NADH-quinone oxidoreductase subunit J
LAPEETLFYVFGAVAVIASVLVIAQRNPIHSVLLLIASFGALSGLYVLLQAPFLAVIQIIVYAGAIMVLFVFVIMLLNAGEEERTNWSKIAQYVGWPLGGVLLLALPHFLYHSEPGAAIANSAANPPAPVDTVALSNLLFRQYLFPFEATSILILVAILGAFVLARKDE